MWRALVAMVCVMHGSELIAIPAWAKNHTSALSGTHYQTVCSGSAPAVDLARREAIETCKASASQMLDSTSEIKSLIVETEKNVSYHQEVSTNVTVQSLQCIPQREEIEPLDTDSFQVWILCRFDLSKTKVQSKSPEPQEVEKVSALESSKEKLVINLLVMPNCRDVIVRGLKSRVVPCNQSPLPIVLSEGDKTMLVRGDGKKPIELDASKLKRREREIIPVYFDRN